MCKWAEFSQGGYRLADFADRRKSDKVPVERLPRIPASQIDDLPTGGDGGGLTQAQVDGRIGAAFRIGALRDATRALWQDIADSFTGGGWADVSAQAAPAVSTTHKATAFDSNDLSGTAFVQRATFAPHFAGRYIAIRIPVDYGTALNALRLRIGDSVPDDTDIFQSLSGLVPFATSAGNNYYSVLVADKPAADGIGVQALTPWSFSHFVRQFVNSVSSRLTVSAAGELDLAPSQRIPVSAGPADEDKLLYMSGVAGGGLRAGDPPATPANALIDIIDGSLTGITIINSGTDQTGRLTAFAPSFDLDDPDKQAGLLNGELVLTIAANADSISFGDISPYDELTERVSDFTFVSNVRESADWSNTRLEGVLFATVPIYAGASKQGDLRFYLAHDASNVLGYYWHWEAAAGSFTITVSATLELAYFHNDSGGSSPRSFLESRFRPLPWTSRPAR